MSSLKLQGATSGEITLTVPSVAGTNTLTLPASTGTIITDTAPKVGNVLQVVQGTYSTQTEISATSYTDTGLSATITPSSTSSKILVIAGLSGRTFTQQNNDRTYYIGLVRGTTLINQNITVLQTGTGALGYSVAPLPTSQVYLDSPSTTSATTYKIQFKVDNAASNTGMQICTLSSNSRLTLIEVAG